MKITARLPIPAYRAANSRPTPELSPQAANRLKLLEQWHAMRDEGMTTTKAAAILRVPRACLFRWQSRLRERGLRGLEPDSRRPRNVRRPTREPALVNAVIAQRTAPPWFGKDKIAVLLRRRGWKVSASAVGRILADAKRRGALREPPRPGVARRKPRPARPYAVRKPSAYRPTRPGDLVQIDTLDVRPAPGVILKHFTARDVVSRCDVLQVGTQATSASAARFLDAVVARMPFPVKAVQVDGGSEFQGAFEDACKERGILLFVLPPHSPKLNGHVERAHRTHVEEFYNFYDGELTMGPLNRALREWEAYYNAERPHQSLGWLSPMEYLAEQRLRTAS